MKFLLTSLFVALLAAASPVLATSQEPDNLILEGEQLSLATNPLSPLIQDGRIKLPEPAERWSSNWRGYVATWTVKNEQMLLSKIDVLLRPEGAAEGTDAVSVNVLPQVFPEQTEVPAEWFSGALVVPRGEVVNYVHMGYGSTYERYTVLRIEHGRVLSRRDLSTNEFENLRKERFSAYQKTAEYAARFKEAREQLSPSEAERFIYQFAAEEYMSGAP